MRKKTEKLVACPISGSSNNDAYNDICKATGLPCPYFVDEGMSVCKSKMRCLKYFMNNGSNIDLKQVLKLIISDTKSSKGKRSKYTNTIKKDKSMQDVQLREQEVESNLFAEELEEALKNHETLNEENGELNE